MQEYDKVVPSFNKRWLIKAGPHAFVKKLKDIADVLGCNSYEL